MFELLEEDFSKNAQICGVDEAGRGPLAGPLSFALVYFPKNILEKVHKGEILKGLNDSKKLTEKKRESLFEELISLPITYSHKFISNRSIDKFGLSYCIFSAVSFLVKKSNLNSSFLLIDGNYNFENRLIGSKIRFDYKSVIKGDSKLASIAAASIIAKVKRDRYMVEISSKYPKYNFDKHKGYGTKSHIEKIKLLGPSKIHRMSFLKGILEK
ncbi:MAG: ribonuclease HII [Leptospiraceae bacterium]|nr:ribonuclease HII [Leptospiraceae bacterium]